MSTSFAFVRKFPWNGPFYCWPQWQTLTDKVVDARIAEHVNRHQLLPVFQSAYRLYHSTETAVACILNDMIGVLDQGRSEL